jgi:hypothetical protein
MADVTLTVDGKEVTVPQGELGARRVGWDVDWDVMVCGQGQRMVHRGCLC